MDAAALWLTAVCGGLSFPQASQVEKDKYTQWEKWQECILLLKIPLCGLSGLR